VAVGKKARKPIIGILGGICSGKSAVAAEFARFGCAVIDADRMAKELLDRPDIRPKIVELFGKEILNAAGKIERQKLAEIVFGQAQGLYLQALTNIIHPPVLEETKLLIETYQNDEKVRAIVLDMPLLAEVGWEKHCDKLIFVDCDLKIRLQRAKIRGIGDENKLKMRENFQISLDKKAQMSDYILHNDSDLSKLALEVRSIFKNIMA
jgi:dephospho-CoA kinase